MNKLFEIKFGSHLYGTDTPDSDLDLKSIYLPTAKEIVLGSYAEVKSITRRKKENERNNKDDIDIEIFSLDRFLSDLMDGQTWALDMLFAPTSSYTESTPEGLALMATIFENKDKLLTRNINAFVGYARKQAAKYGIKGSRMDALKRTMELLDSLPLWDRLREHEDKIRKLVEDCKELVSMEKTPLVEIAMVPGPNKVDLLEHLHVCGRKISFTSTVKHAKECYKPILDEYGDRSHKAHLAGGKDWKAISHAVRVNNEALELLQTGHITFPRPDKDLLLAIKLNGTNPTLEWDYVANLIEEGMVALTEAHANSSLPDKPDREWADDFVYDVYSTIVKNS